MSDWTTFKAPGPVAAAFQASDAPIRMLRGPVGSGKTATCLLEVLYRGLRQEPSPVDGVRYSRFAIIRDTYPSLQRSTIASWREWVPKVFGKFTDGGRNGPSVHHLRFKRGNGGIVDIEVNFVAIGDNAVEDVLRGYELTGAYVNEADRLSREVVMFLRGRVGRYPSKRHGGATWSGVWADCNPPDVDNWIYEDFEENPSDAHAMFAQPSGFALNAENRENLPEGYYERQAEGAPDWYVRRMIRNEYGYSREGQPVYGEWSDSLHTAGGKISAVRGLPLIIGADAGRTPAFICCQLLPDGRWHVLSELVLDGVGARSAGEALARHLREFYPGMRSTGWADPAAAHPGDADDRSWIEIVGNASGVRFRPAPSNNPTLRQESVRQPLTRLIDGKPGFLLDPDCKVLRKGFNSGYHYRRIQVSNTFADTPAKNGYSHPHDGLQYALLGGGEHHEVLGRRSANRQAAKPVQAQMDFEVFS